jgi:hypothetical protein
MPKRCKYVHPNGKPCRRWPQEDSSYCYHHTTRYDAIEPSHGEDLHPLLRLTTPNDVFDVVRETLNAARLGRIRPSQVYAVGYMVQQWRDMYHMKMIDTRRAGLHRQMNPDLVDEEEISDDARAPVAELAVLPDKLAKPEIVAAPKPASKKSA